MLKKILILAVFALGFLALEAEENEPIVIETQLEDGSANQWTQKDLVEALGLMNRMYHRDMKSHEGRRRWHGEAKSEIYTNECIQVMRYEDGFAVTNKWSRPESVIERKQRLAAIRENRKAALEKKVESMPPTVAEIYKNRLEVDFKYEDREVEKVTIDVATGEEVK